MVKKRILIFCFLQILTIETYSQEYVYQDVKTLLVENRNFLDIIDKIIVFEGKYMDDTMSDARSYIIDYSVLYDTTIIITSVYPIDIGTVLLSSMYGVFMHHLHLICVRKKIGENFIQSESVISIETVKITDDIIHFIIDDSQTEWKFLMREGKLIFYSRNGFSSQKKYQEKYMFKIEIIEEEIDDFPDN